MRIIVEYAGWCEADPETTMFQYIGEDDSKIKYINGNVWLELDENEKSQYILENITKTIDNALDVDWVDIDLLTEEPV